MSDPQRVRPRVLVVAHTTTFLTELSLFGDLVRDRTSAEVVFHCAFEHWTANTFADKCAAQGVSCLLEPLSESLARYRSDTIQEEPWTPSLSVRPARFIERLSHRMAIALPGVGPKFVAESMAFASRAKEIAGLLSTLKASLLVLGGDMPGYDTSLFVKIAHRSSVPVLVVPSTMSNGLEQAEVYYGNPDHQVTGWERGLIATLFPKWVREHKGRRLFRCPPGRVLAMELAGIAPPQPWIFNSGHADVIAMESEAMVDYYAKAGMKNDRMILTGSLSDDAMANRLEQSEALRRDLCGRLGLDPGRLLVLAALPPDFLYVTGGRPQCDFQDYRRLAEFWVDSLAALKDCNCLVALHPSVEVDSMRWIEERGVRIAPQRTADTVPLCDIYVASISSTIRWAIACGKPVVNYDVYRYRYTDFLGVPGVITTEEQPEFRAILSRLAGDEAYRAQIAGAQRSVAARWGLLDGRVGDRMLAQVERLSGIAAVKPRELP